MIIWCLCPFLPDSPRLLIRKGRTEDALEVIAALEGNGATIESASVQAQFNIIKNILEFEHINTYSWAQLLSGNGLFFKKTPRFFLGLRVDQIIRA